MADSLAQAPRAPREDLTSIPATSPVALDLEGDFSEEWGDLSIDERADQQALWEDSLSEELRTPVHITNVHSVQPGSLLVIITVPSAKAYSMLQLGRFPDKCLDMPLRAVLPADRETPLLFSRCRLLHDDQLAASPEGRSSDAPTSKTKITGITGSPTALPPAQPPAAIDTESVMQMIAKCASAHQSVDPVADWGYGVHD